MSEGEPEECKPGRLVFEGWRNVPYLLNGRTVCNNTTVHYDLGGVNMVTEWDRREDVLLMKRKPSHSCVLSDSDEEALTRFLHYKGLSMPSVIVYDGPVVLLELDQADNQPSHRKLVLLDFRKSYTVRAIVLPLVKRPKKVTPVCVWHGHELKILDMGDFDDSGGFQMKEFVVGRRLDTAPQDLSPIFGDATPWYGVRDTDRFCVNEKHFNAAAEYDLLTANQWILVYNRTRMELHVWHMDKLLHTTLRTSAVDPDCVDVAACSAMLTVLPSRRPVQGTMSVVAVEYDSSKSSAEGFFIHTARFDTPRGHGDGMHPGDVYCALNQRPVTLSEVADCIALYENGTVKEETFAKRQILESFGMELDPAKAPPPAVSPLLAALHRRREALSDELASMRAEKARKTQLLRMALQSLEDYHSVAHPLVRDEADDVVDGQESYLEFDATGADRPCCPFERQPPVVGARLHGECNGFDQPSTEKTPRATGPVYSMNMGSLGDSSSPYSPSSSLLMPVHESATSQRCWTIRNAGNVIQARELNPLEEDDLNDPSRILTVLAPTHPKGRRRIGFSTPAWAFDDGGDSMNNSSDRDGGSGWATVCVFGHHSKVTTLVEFLRNRGRVRAEIHHRHGKDGAHVSLTAAHWHVIRSDLHAWSARWSSSLGFCVLDCLKTAKAGQDRGIGELAKCHSNSSRSQPTPGRQNKSTQGSSPSFAEAAHSLLLSRQVHGSYHRLGQLISL
eukprot:Clim_evm18s13 gene=Clim_evmTU18s13